MATILALVLVLIVIGSVLFHLLSPWWMTSTVPISTIECSPRSSWMRLSDPAQRVWSLNREGPHFPRLLTEMNFFRVS